VLTSNIQTQIVMATIDSKAKLEVFESAVAPLSLMKQVLIAGDAHVLGARS